MRHFEFFFLVARLGSEIVLEIPDVATTLFVNEGARTGRIVTYVRSHQIQVSR